LAFCGYLTADKSAGAVTINQARDIGYLRLTKRCLNELPISRSHCFFF
jgi:hypothetical protein